MSLSTKVSQVIAIWHFATFHVTAQSRPMRWGRLKHQKAFRMAETFLDLLPAIRYTFCHLDWSGPLSSHVWRVESLSEKTKSCVPPLRRTDSDEADGYWGKSTYVCNKDEWDFPTPPVVKRGGEDSALQGWKNPSTQLFNPACVLLLVRTCLR